MRLPTPPSPAELGVTDGLAYSLWLPEQPARGGIVVLHGAGSTKESHHDMARAAMAWGFAAVCFDQRGHGESEGALDGRAIDDVGRIMALLPPGIPVALRGSSMGGWLALVAARELGAAAVVAICPANADLLLLGLRSGSFRFAADPASLVPLIEAHELDEVVAGLTCPLLLLHAENDERVPVADTRRLFELAPEGRKRLIVTPGGHHRSIQHDAELQGLSLRFVERAFAGRDRP